MGRRISIVHQAGKWGGTALEVCSSTTDLGPGPAVSQISLKHNMVTLIIPGWKLTEKRGKNKHLYRKIVLNKTQF